MNKLYLKKFFSIFKYNLSYNTIDVLDIMSTYPLFLAIKRGLALVLPLIIIGSFAILLRNFPLLDARQRSTALLGESGRQLCDALISSSFDIASLVLVCALSGVSALYVNLKLNNTSTYISPLMSMVVVMSCYFIILSPITGTLGGSVFSMDRGLLLAMCIAVVGSGIFLRLSRCRRLQLPLDVVGRDPVVRDVFVVIPAAIITILIFGFFKGILIYFDITDPYNAVRSVISLPFSHAKDDLAFGILYTGISQILWFFGAHGPNLLNSVEDNILIPASLANMQVAASGASPTFIFTKAFFDAFTRIGGSGCTLCLILAIMYKSEDKGLRKLSLFAIIPALCNVNEPILFGIPLVLNPIYFIPFILIPLLQTVVAYAAMLSGLVPKTVISVTWTTPALLSGYLVTGSINGTLLQCVNIAIGVLIYLPFVKVADDIRVMQGRRALPALYKIATRGETAQPLRPCLDHPGDMGRLSKALLRDLENSLANYEQLYVVYQPQLDGSGQHVLGVEALLRWRHPIYGNIAPPITVALAEEAGLIHKLGQFILSEACEQRAAWKAYVSPELRLSVNVSPKQLQNPDFGEDVLTILRNSGLERYLLELEITESSVLEPDAKVLEMLTYLHSFGIRVAIDDFGMGHASLRYLQTFPIDTVKLDRSLTNGKEGDVNERIVRSMLELSRSLNIEVVVEGVEIAAQVRRFLAMGFTTFQGYYFSRPLAGEDCLAFIRQLDSQRLLTK